MRGSPVISAADLLTRRADDYAIRAAHQAELADTGDDKAREAAAQFTLLEIVLRELAEVIDEELAA